MKYWLMKSEPDEFSIEHLRRRPKQTEPWTGVRNYQARNHLRSMQPGDRVLFHHSSVSPAGVAGLAEVVSDPFPDPTAMDSKSHYFDPRAAAKGNTWCAVHVRFVETFPRLLSLDEMRQIPGLESMLVLRKGMRLSVQPVTAQEYRVVIEWMRKHPRPPEAEAPKKKTKTSRTS
jgi:predicted RNA-binding protein with PUA-like domain